MNGGAPGAGVVPIFLELAPADIALVKFVFESYEGVAVIRTIDRQAAVIVAIVSADFEHLAREILESLRAGVDFRVLATTPPGGEDWLDT